MSGFIGNSTGLPPVEQRDAASQNQTDATYTQAGASVVTFTASGTWLVMWSCMGFNAGGGVSQIILTVNGVDIAETERTVENSAFAASLSAQAAVSVSAGQTAQIRAKKGTSASVTTKNRVLTAWHKGG